MSLANLFNDARTILVFLAMISVLVAAHEYGHYVFARLFGMGVEDFSIGMGKKVSVWKRKTYTIPVPRDYVYNQESISHGAAFEGGDRPVDSVLIETDRGKALQETTEFTERMLPIGGFVRIKGMIPQDDGSEVRIPGGFYSKPPWQRLVVLIAGPVASVVSGIVVLIVLFMLQGIPRAIDKPILDFVIPDSVAAAAKLQRGDRIVDVDDKPISTFHELVAIIQARPNQKVKLQYVRGNQGGSVTLIPNATEGPELGPDLERGVESTSHGVIGVLPMQRIVSVGLAGATLEAVRYPVLAVESMFAMVKKPSSAKDQAGGVITMVRTTSDAAQAGLASTIAFACILSISVGIFNLLPIPPLDGGQMAMAFAELLRGGKRLSIQVQQTVTSAGMLLVLVLFVVVVFIDVQRYSGGGPANPAAAHSAPSQTKK